MRRFKRVAIIGVGLIGGSVALEIKRRKLAGEIVGVSRHQETLRLAKKNRVIDQGSQDLKIIQGADLVILAAPVNTILKLARPISRLIRRDCLVTDTGSTKQQIVAKLEKIFPRYIGSHPLAGSERRGVKNATLDLFKRSLCIMTPTPKTSPAVKNRIRQLWNCLGAKVIFLAPANHDQVLSLVSHLPHAVAFSLIDTVPKNYLKFASGGLKDTTRIAASDAQLWTEIFLSNSRNLLKAIALLEKNLTRIKSAIKQNNAGQLVKILKRAQAKRESL